MTERPPRFGEHRALEQLGLALEGLGDGFSRKRKDLEKSAALARQGWAAAAAVIDIADTVTEMRLVKHAFKAGIPAQQGIEH